MRGAGEAEGVGVWAYWCVLVSRVLCRRLSICRLVRDKTTFVVSAMMQMRLRNRNRPAEVFGSVRRCDSGGWSAGEAACVVRVLESLGCAPGTSWPGGARVIQKSDYHLPFCSFAQREATEAIAPANYAKRSRTKAKGLIRFARIHYSAPFWSR